jgi:heme a synthase
MAAGTAQASLSLDEPREHGLRLVRAWLYGLAGLVIAMVAVGGATRLTGSGLSITEWKPVTGAIPPLSEAAWTAAFEKYRQISQYELLNSGMSLAEFKVIYLWEWSHRQLGRVIGLAFFLPLAWFWFRGVIRGGFALTLLAIGALGGLQGAIGWIMVASGLEPGMTAVAPIKLMLHLITASAILASLIWVAAGLRPGRQAAGDRAGGARVGAEVIAPRSGGAVASPGRNAPLVILALVLLQIALGGLVAGSKAGLTYNTWPLMDGRLVPPASALTSVQPFIENFVDNVVLVQFNHRMVAYALVAAALWHAWAARLAYGTAAYAKRATALAALVFAQMTLGIVTLVLVVPLWAGLLHQVFAMVVLGMAVVHARLSTPERTVRV